MNKWTQKQLQEHIRKNITDYGLMVVVAILYRKIYGEYPKIGMSGQQVEFAESVKDKLPEPIKQKVEAFLEFKPKVYEDFRANKIEGRIELMRIIFNIISKLHNLQKQVERKK